jgi:hypothetical protein
MLGVPLEEAAELARRPLPETGETQGDAAPVISGTRSTDGPAQR